MNNQSNQSNWRIGVNIQIAQTQAARQSHPKVSKSRKYKGRHTETWKKKFEGLIAENQFLKDTIKELISHYSQVHARGKNENSVVAHSICDSDYPGLDVQDHQRVDSDLGGRTDWLDVLELDDLEGNLFSTEVENPSNYLTDQQISDF